jgi:hypothetical protein
MSDEIERVARAICQDMRWQAGAWETLIPAAKAAIAAIRPPEPPADTVRVRVAVAVGAEWPGNDDDIETMVVGYHGFDTDKQALDACVDIIGSAVVTAILTADLPRPVAREVVARVEPSHPNQKLP